MAHSSFTLPLPVQDGREHGQRTLPRHVDRPIRGDGDFADDADPGLRALPGATVYAQGLTGPRPLEPHSHNILTVVGILPDQVHHIRSYFASAGLAPAFQPEFGSRGNWICLDFREPIEDIQHRLGRRSPFAPVVQLSSAIVVTCFIGIFEREQCVLVQSSAEAGRVQQQKLFKIQDVNEDLTALPIEDKTLLTAVREFGFGEREIPRKHGRLYWMVKTWFGSGDWKSWER
jgi:hypothetical protein